MGFTRLRLCVGVVLALVDSLAIDTSSITEGCVFVGVIAIQSVLVMSVDVIVVLLAVLLGLYHSFTDLLNFVAWLGDRLRYDFRRCLDRAFSFCSIMPLWRYTALLYCSSDATW